MLAGSLALAAACGGDDPTATPTTQPQATATPTGTAATATPSGATPTPTAPSNGGERPVPGSVLTIAAVDVGPQLYYANQLTWPYSERNNNLRIFESLLTFDGQEISSKIAESWSIDDTGVTYTIREGVPFHDNGGDWGEVTADDVVWSWNDTTAEGNLHTMSGNVTRDFGPVEKVDERTVRMPFLEQATIRWSMSARTAGNGLPVQSKKAFDANGADWMILNAVGTGPYRVVEHVADDRIVLQAVPDHWDRTAAYERIEVLEVPEQSTRLSMLSTGAADMVQVGVPFFGEASGIQGVRVVTGQYGGTTGSSVFPAGQTYLKPEWPPSPDLPWVGDPNDSASMESAANVRKAMSYAIDREGIIDAILGGHGCPQYQYRVDSCNPNWDHKWDTPYDPERARELLSDAGYPNGFNFTYFIPTGLNETLEEVGEAIAPMWEAIGLTPTIQKTAYSARRPEMLERTIKDVWIFIHGDALTPDELVPQMGELGGEGTWNMGINRPESLEFRDRVLVQTEFEDAWDIVAEWTDWLYEEQPVVQAVTWRDAWAVGPGVASWEAPLHSSAWPTFVDRIEPAQ